MKRSSNDLSVYTTMMYWIDTLSMSPEIRLRLTTCAFQALQALDNHRWTRIACCLRCLRCRRSRCYGRCAKRWRSASSAVASGTCSTDNLCRASTLRASAYRDWPQRGLDTASQLHRLSGVVPPAVGCRPASAAAAHCTSRCIQTPVERHSSIAAWRLRGGVAGSWRLRRRGGCCR